MLGALRVYAGGRALSGWRIASTSFLLLLSLLSKETAVCAVFLIPALDWRLQRLKAAQRAYVTFGLLLLAYLIVRVSVADVASGVPSALTQYALKQFLSIPYRVFSHPWSSAGPAPPGGVAFGIAAALLALLLSAAWKLGGRLLIGPAVIAISTVPLVQYLWVTPELHNARYLYFPAIGWAFLMAQLAVCSARDPKWQLLTGSAITLFSAACLVWNTPPWRLAAQLVEAMAVEVAAGGDGRAAAAAWQARAGVTVEMRDGIPVSSQGVDILRNSHEEFVAYYRQRRMTHSGADATR